MTGIDAILPPEDALIDRIVDGTLTPAELRAAIDRLERIPDGWKRCAAAFLEAQCWRESFRALGEPAGPQAECKSAPVPLTVTGRQRTHHRWVRAAMAAGIVAASFTMGWLGHASRRMTAAEPATAGQSIAILTQRSGDLQSAPESAAVVEPEGPARPAAPPWRADRLRTDPAGLVRTVARLRIGNETARTEVPILAGPGITEEWLRRQPPPVSEHGRVVFQRHGYQVDQRRRLITAITADGQRVTVPIDQVLIRRVGNQSL